MTPRPCFLLRRPAVRAPAAPDRSQLLSARDPLSDLLRVVRLDSAFFFAVEATEPWSVEAVAARELSPRILPHAGAGQRAVRAS